MHYLIYSLRQHSRFSANTLNVIYISFVHGKSFRVNENGNIFIPRLFAFLFLTLTQLALFESNYVEEASRPGFSNFV